MALQVIFFILNYIIYAKRSAKLKRLNCLAKEFKFVGLHMTENGGLDPHVHELRKKIDKQNAVLRHLQSGCTHTYKRTLFQGLIYSHIMTSTSAYLPRVNKTQIKRLQSKVKFCLRTISGIPIYHKYNFDGSLFSGSQN